MRRSSIGQATRLTTRWTCTGRSRSRYLHCSGLLIPVGEKKHIALIHVREKNIYRLLVKSKECGNFAETASQSRVGRDTVTVL